MMNSPQILLLGNPADAVSPEALSVDIIADLVCPGHNCREASGGHSD